MYHGLTLKADVKRKWVKALRSGKYKQGNYTLHNTQEEYCCLGVFCETQKVPSHKGNAVYVYNIPTQWGMSSRESTLDGEWFTKFCKFEPQVDRVSKEGAAESVLGQFMYMNDTQNKSFNEIADWIEANL